MSEFDRGVFYAAYLICELHDQPTIAADIIREANLDCSEIGGLDDCERKTLMGLNATEKLNLTDGGSVADENGHDDLWDPGDDDLAVGAR